MPPYPGSNQAKLEYENKQLFAFQAEAVAVGEYSRSHQLRRERGNSYPNGFSVELNFSGTPGVFEIDVMTADQDVLTSYVPTGVINNVNSITGYTARGEYPLAYAKYVLLYVRTWPNTSVLVTGLITR
jgi:hypothetical protein